jgi:peptide/nickel transport system permease protein
LSGGGTSFAAYAGRRLLAVAVVVVITPSLTFVVLGALRNEVTVLEQARQLPGYLEDTFLHLSLGDAPPVYQESLHDLVLQGLAVDVALLAGGTLLGVAIGLATGVASAVRRRSGTDRALAIGSALALSAPVYWFGFIVLTLFAPQSGYLVQIPFVSWYGGYVPFGEDPLRWLQALWVPWLVLAAPLGAACHRMTRASMAEVLDEDFIRTARAKGVTEKRVVRRHALRAALPPVLGLASVSMALMVTNVVLIEPAFRLPGFFRQADIGQFRGEQSHVPSLDVVQALVLEAALLISVTMLLADLLRARIDPRAGARR